MDRGKSPTENDGTGRGKKLWTKLKKVIIPKKLRRRLKRMKAAKESSSRLQDDDRLMEGYEPSSSDDNQGD